MGEEGLGEALANLSKLLKDACRSKLKLAK
jgi:hypothetical protein